MPATCHAAFHGGIDVSAATDLAVNQEPLDRAECLSLLAQASFGRLLLSVDCLPAAQPVFIALVDDEILALLGPGPEREAAERGDVVALQVDGTEIDGHAAWSVREAAIVLLTRSLRQRLSTTKLSSALSEASALLRLPLDVVAGERTRWTSQ